MTKFTGLVAALVVAMGVTLLTPAASEACWRSRGGYYVEPCYNSYPVTYYYSTGDGCYTQVAPGYTYSGTYYYPSGGNYYYPSGGNYYYYPSGRGSYSGYYRVGNVIINGRRWGDIGYRYSHGDLIRW
jgi:hypothetical protein